MSNGRYQAPSHTAKRQPKNTRLRRGKIKKYLLLTLSVVLLLSIAAGSTVAYLFDSEVRAANDFKAGHVDCVVTGSDNKFTVMPDPETNTPVYIRAAVAVNYKDGNGAYNLESPGFTVAGNWTQKNDGYFYYNGVVEPGDEPQLTVAVASAPTGYTQEIVVLAEAIQSQPANAVTDAWVYTPSGN